MSMDPLMHRRDRTIYVNNIAKATTEDDLFTLFQRAGPIEKVIFKNADGTPQHALIVFRRIESVMFCLDNVDYFQLRRQPLGIRPLRESRLTVKPQVPHSAGFEVAQQQLFKFDTDSIQQLGSSQSEKWRNPPTPTWAPEPAGSPLFLQSSPLTLPRQAPRVQLQNRRTNKPSPLQLPTAQNIRQIWVPADQRETYVEPFTAPPFLSASAHFNFPTGQSGNRVLDHFRDWAPPSSPIPRDF